MLVDPMTRDVQRWRAPGPVSSERETRSRLRPDAVRAGKVSE